MTYIDNDEVPSKEFIETLTDKNCVEFAIQAYTKPNAILSEFDEDYKRLKYQKRLIKKYVNSGVFKDRLILNHCIILINVFGIEPAVRLLFLKIEEKDWAVLKTILAFLYVLPRTVRQINGKDIKVKDIPLDLNVVKILKSLG